MRAEENMERNEYIIGSVIYDNIDDCLHDVYLCDSHERGYACVYGACD